MLNFCFKATGRFILFTFSASWLLAGLYALAGFDAHSPLFSLVAMVYMLVPAVVVVFLQMRHHGGNVATSLWVSFSVNRWFFVALFLPALLVALSVVFNLLVPGVVFNVGEGSYVSGRIVLLVVLAGFVAGCSINALFAFGEELGWRGYMVRRLVGLPLLPASLFIGLVWGVWHAPLILLGHNYPSHPVAGVFMMVAFCMLLSPLMVYITLKSRSVVASAVMHGTVNALAGFPLLCLVGGSDLSNGLQGYAGFAAVTVISLMFFLFDRYVTKERLFTRPLE